MLTSFVIFYIFIRAYHIMLHRFISFKIHDILSTRLILAEMDAIVDEISSSVIDHGAT